MFFTFQQVSKFCQFFSIFLSIFQLPLRRSRSTKFSRSKFRSTSTAVYTRGCVYIHSTVSLLINGGSFSKEDENIFQKSARVVPVILVPQFQMEPREPIFEKCSHLRKKGGVLMLFPGLCGGLYGQNLPYG
jgi:hypothetical protein